MLNRFNVYISAPLLISVFSGMLANISGLKSLGAALFDLSIFIGLVVFVLYDIKKFSLKSSFFLLYFFLFEFAVWCFQVGLSGNNPWMEAVLGFRNNVMYLLYPAIVASVVRSNSDLMRLIAVVKWTGIYVCCFGLLQFAFSNILPQSLLVLQEEDVFGFFGTDIVRPTALIGNTIVYSGACILVMSMAMAIYLNSEAKNSYIFIALLAFGALFVAQSRLAIVGSVLIVLVIILISSRSASALIKYSLWALGGVLLLLLVAVSYFPEFSSFVLERLLSQEATTQTSDEVHFLEIALASEEIKRNLISGVGLGSQGQSGFSGLKIITDGFWWQLMLETGIVGALLYLLFVLTLMHKLFFWSRQSEGIVRAVLIFGVAALIYFIAAGWMNSSFLGRYTSMATWTLVWAALHVASYSKKIGS